ATVLVLLGVPGLEIVAGLALALVLPGRALVDMLDRGRRWSRVERIVLVPALSLATVVLGGILLNAARIPLQAPAWALLCGGAAVIATPFGTVRPRPRIQARLAVPVVAASLILVAAGWLSLHSAAEQRDAVAVTSLSMRPVGADVRLDVQTQHASAAAYRLVVTGPDGFHVTFAPAVGSDGRWQHDIPAPSDGRVTADLYRAGDATPYRSVFLDPQ
ncbi:MAG TPA: hypothetical protein VGJ28_27135, partial [Micromonosporaceae bacterium]